MTVRVRIVNPYASDPNSWVSLSGGNDISVTDEGVLKVHALDREGYGSLVALYASGAWFEAEVAESAGRS